MANFDPSTPNTVVQLENRKKARSQQNSSDESAGSEEGPETDSDPDEDDAEEPEPDNEFLSTILGDEECAPSTRTKQPGKILIIDIFSLLSQQI
ncbi:hypothetical protein L0F63_000676 [Massospora cicadina]|nr:hypothetical protein L0F63_000676 [Massospora cicadina]